MEIDAIAIHDFPNSLWAEICAADDVAALAATMRSELQRGAAGAVGEILHEDWILKPKSSGGISLQEIDQWYEPARQAGATGGKLLGAGGGEPPLETATMRGVSNKTLSRILGGAADASIRFDELRGLLICMGFSERVRGDHHIFAKPNVEEILNLQPRGSSAKPYQVKQVRNVIVRYGLAGEVE